MRSASTHLALFIRSLFSRICWLRLSLDEQVPLESHLSRVPPPTGNFMAIVATLDCRLVLAQYDFRYHCRNYALTPNQPDSCSFILTISHHVSLRSVLRKLSRYVNYFLFYRWSSYISLEPTRRRSLATRMGGVLNESRHEFSIHFLTANAGFVVSNWVIVKFNYQNGYALIRSTTPGPHSVWYGFCKRIVIDFRCLIWNMIIHVHWRVLLERECPPIYYAMNMLFILLSPFSLCFSLYSSFESMYTYPRILYSSRFNQRIQRTY